LRSGRGRGAGSECSPSPEPPKRRLIELSAGLALRLEREAVRLAEGEYRALLDSMDAAYSSAALELQD